jgi:helicase
MATRANLSLDDMLGVHAHVLTYVLQTLVEQGIALLAKLLEDQGRALAPAVAQFPEHLRFGVPTPASRMLAVGGVRHRRAVVELGTTDELRATESTDSRVVFATARQLLMGNIEVWRARLGSLVFENTLHDLRPNAQGAQEEAP